MSLLRFRWRASLRIKLLVAALLVLVPIIVLASVSIASTFQADAQDAYANETRIAEGVGVIVQNVFGEGIQLDRTFATDPVVVSLDPARLNGDLGRLQPIYPQFSEPLAVYDAQGRLVSAATSPATADVSGSAFFQRVLTTGQPTVGNVTTFPATGRTVVPTAAPIVDAQGNRIGATVSELDVEALPDELARVQRAPGQEVFLVDPSGTLAFYTGVSHLSEAQRDLSQFAPVKRAQAGKSFSGQVADPVLGDQRLLVTRPAPQPGWVIGVSTPVSVALASATANLRDAVIALAGVTLFSVLLALGLGSLLVGPLKDLTEAATAVGQGDLGRRVSVSTGDELEQLGDAFNSMAEQLRERERMQEDLLRAVSHDLRNPLAAVEGQAELLQRQLARGAPAAEVQGRAQAILTSSRRMDAMIADLVESARLEEGQLHLRTKPVDMAACIRDFLQRQAGVLDIGRIHLEAPEGLPPIEADTDRLERILGNLLSNALRYSTPGTPVTVSLRREDGQVVTAVSDVGPGIAPEDLAHLFERYYRAPSTERRAEGLGLGLYITRLLVEAQGGRIWAESEPGKGSTFSFGLPIAAQEAAPGCG